MISIGSDFFWRKRRKKKNKQTQGQRVCLDCSYLRIKLRRMELHRGVLCSACLLLVLYVTCLEGRSEDETPRDFRNPRSCGEAEMCCSGQNNTCFVFGHRVDRSTDSDRCYCDANCLIMGDCCMDYAHVCKGNIISFISFIYLSLCVGGQNDMM